jgi:hypothetical protein
MRTGNQGKVLMRGLKHGRTIPDIHLLDIFYLGDHGNANKRSVQYNPAPQSSLIGCGPDLRRRIRLK